MSKLDGAATEEPAQRRSQVMAETAPAVDVGQRVLSALAKGRERGIRLRKERGAALCALVLQKAEQDMARGKPRRGRAGRIRRNLSFRVSERWILKIISEL